MINRAKMPRQLRNKGGITNAVPREKYGLGSKIKDRFRKLIPNELADIAVKAAPFVAPFNPGIAGLMRGIGRFDQRGSISDALKQGAATFGLGAGARALGGADPFGGGLRGGFTSPLDTEKTTKFKKLFDRQKAIEDLSKTKDKPGFLRGAAEETIGKVPVLKNLSPKVQEKLLAGTITSGASALYSYFTGEFEPQEPGETVGEYMARRKERVKSQMRQVMDSYYTPLRNPSYAAMSDEEKDNFIDGIVGQTELEGTTDYQGMAKGGRVGYQTGGVTMANTLAENIARNRARQQEFSESIAPAQQAARAAILAATPKSLKGSTTKLYSGTVAKDPFGGSKFFATPDLATAKTYATSSPLRGSPLSGPVTGRILEAEVPTSQAQSLLKKGLTGTREVVLDPQAAKTLFETGKGTLKGAGSLATKAAVAGTKALPFVGGAVSLADAALRAKEGDLIGAGLGAAGAVPVLGLPALGAQVLYDQFIKKDSKESKPETPKEDPTGYNFDSEYYRNNPGSKDYDRFKVAYAKSLGMDDKISVGSDGQVYVDFGSWDPSRTYQAYRSNKKTNYDRPFFDIIFPVSEERKAELKKQENILRSLYGAPGKGRASVAKGGMPTGIMRTNKAGVIERDYRDKGGFVPVGIKEKADDVPAMLSKNEFVFTADAVRGAGGGSIEKGAQRMYNTMKNLEKRVV